jgi:hypothetical protein
MLFPSTYRCLFTSKVQAYFFAKVNVSATWKSWQIEEGWTLLWKMQQITVEERGGAKLLSSSSESNVEGGWEDFHVFLQRTWHWGPNTFPIGPYLLKVHHLPIALHRGPCLYHMDIWGTFMIQILSILLCTYEKVRHRSLKFPFLTHKSLLKFLTQSKSGQNTIKINLAKLS